jgi:hypothetical protein
MPLTRRVAYNQASTGWLTPPLRVHTNEQPACARSRAPPPPPCGLRRLTPPRPLLRTNGSSPWTPGASDRCASMPEYANVAHAVLGGRPGHASARGRGEVRTPRLCCAGLCSPHPSACGHGVLSFECITPPCQMTAGAPGRRPAPVVPVGGQEVGGSPLGGGQATRTARPLTPARRPPPHSRTLVCLPLCVRP